jgi:uncharacterized membrane-anchored protein
MSEWIAEIWILVPVGFLLLTGVWITLRSGRAQATHNGLRLMVSNLTSTVVLVSLGLMVLFVMHSAVGYRLPLDW